MTDTAPNRFPELVESLLRREGMSPHAGRILGHLMMAEGAVAFSDLARDLRISRGSVSENAAQLESVGLVERIATAGSRAVSFRFRDDAWSALAAGGRQRLAEGAAAARDAAQSGDLSPVQAARIADMIAFQELMQSALADVSAALLAPGKTDR